MSTRRPARIATPSPEILETMDLAVRLLHYARKGEEPKEPVRRHAHLRLAAVRGESREPPEPPKT